MVVLDTDHMSIFERAESMSGQRLHARLAPLEDSEKATTIVCFEEQVRGWLSYLAQASTLVKQIDAYRRLNRQLKNYCDIIVLEFDESAAVQFQRLKQSHIGVGTMDLKIAAITLAHDATLLSGNLKHFHKVPGLKVEDWTT